MAVRIVRRMIDLVSKSDLSVRIYLMDEDLRLLITKLDSFL